MKMKKWISLVLTAAMLAAVVPETNLKVFAEEQESQVTDIVTGYQWIGLVLGGESKEVTPLTGTDAVTGSVIDAAVAAVEVTPEGKLKFTPVGAGQTAVRLGTTEYRILVEASVQESEKHTDPQQMDLYVGQKKQLKLEGIANSDIVWSEGYDTYLNIENTAQMDEDLIAVRGVTGTNTLSFAAIGENEKYFTGDPVFLSDCLYDFEKNTDGYWQVSAQDASGDRVYLNFTYEKKMPNKTQENGGIIFEEIGETEKFYIHCLDLNPKEEAYKDRYLFFNEATHQYDGGNKYDNQSGYAFELYKKAAEKTETQNIPGYEQITSSDQIKEHGKYLIVHSYEKGGVTYRYAIYPSVTGEHFAQSVQITDAAMEKTSSVLTISGAKKGTVTIYADAEKSQELYQIRVSAPEDAPVLDTTPVISETGKASGSPITKITLGADRTYDISQRSYEFQTGTFSLEGFEKTPVTIIDGQIQVTDPSMVTEELTGSLVFTVGENAYKIPLLIEPVVVESQAETSKRNIDMYIDMIYHSTVFYGWIQEVESEETSSEETPAETALEKTCKVSDLTKAVEGEVIYAWHDLTLYEALDFFGYSDENYALTLLASTNSAHHYMRLDTENPMNSQFVTQAGVAGWNQKNIDAASIESLVTAAVGKGCIAAQGFTKDSNDGEISSIVSFRSEKLPTLTKSIYGILGADKVSYRTYTEGMKAQVGEWIFFDVAVETYDGETAIVYNGAELTDQLEGTVFLEEVPEGAFFEDPSRVNTKDIKEDLKADIVSESTKGTVHHYVAVYQIQEKDKGKKIENTVTLDLIYGTSYENASIAANADAKVFIDITDVDVDDLVVDFGLPVSYDIVTGTDREFRVNTSGMAAYGTYTVTHEDNMDDGDITGSINTIVYTPAQVMQGPDQLKLTLEEFGDTDESENLTVVGTTDYYLYVYPANSVYYEEGFADFQGTWKSTGAKGSEIGEDGKVKLQALQLMQKPEEGETLQNYGYDAVYAGETTGSSNGTYAESTTGNDTATLDFTGTGIDVYMNGKGKKADADPSGSVTVIVKDQKGHIEKLMFVDTNCLGIQGNNSDAVNQLDAAYHLPVVSISGLTHGKHTLGVIHTRTQTEVKEKTTYPIYLDGFRVYGTLKEDGVYEVHKEAKPQYLELRNAVISYAGVEDILKEGSDGIQVQDLEADEKETEKTKESIYAEDIAKGFSQVYDKNEGAAGSGFGAAISAAGFTQDVKDLLDNGPKNELFLYPGQTMTFKLNAGLKNVQIGLKAVDHQVEGLTVTVCSTSTEAAGETVTNIPNVLTSSTDLFYVIGDLTEETTITIANTGSGTGVLSITDLKYFTDADTPEGTAVFGALEPKDFIPAAASLGYELKESKNFFMDVTKSDYFYEEVLWAVEQKITSGTSETLFSPREQITRAEAVTMLWRMAGSPKVKDQKNPFGDVKEGSYYYDAVLWAVTQGIITGITKDHFAPKALCTREQAMTMLWRMKGQETAETDLKFTDVTKDKYYTKAIQWAVDKEITEGQSEEFFGVAEVCTRCEFVTFLYRMSR